MMSSTSRHIEVRPPEGPASPNRSGWRASRASFWVVIVLTLTIRSVGQPTLSGDLRDREHIGYFQANFNGAARYTNSDLQGQTGFMYTAIHDNNQTSETRFNLYFDTGSTKNIPPSYESMAYVCPVIPRGVNLTKANTLCLAFQVSYTPFGLVMDKVSIVDATFSDGKSKPLKFDWPVPFHCPSTQPIIEQVRPCSDVKTCLYKIEVGHVNEIKIKLRSKLPSEMAANISNLSPTGFVGERDEIWDKESIDPLNPGDSFPIPGGEVNEAFNVVLKPKFIAGLLELIPPTAEDDVQKTITLEVRHSPDYSHAVRSLFVDLPVKLEPPPWSLLAISATGSILAVTFATLLPGNHRIKVFLSNSGAAIILAIIAEASALLFFKAKCELVLFKIVVDPNWLLTALLIGFLCGLTVTWKFEQIKGWFERADEVEVL